MRKIYSLPLRLPLPLPPPLPPLKSLKSSNSGSTGVAESWLLTATGGRMLQLSSISALSADSPLRQASFPKLHHLRNLESVQTSTSNYLFFQKTAFHVYYLTQPHRHNPQLPQTHTPPPPYEVLQTGGRPRKGESTSSLSVIDRLVHPAGISK